MTENKRNNTGVLKGKTAALSVGASVAVPEAIPGTKSTDWNDIACERGLDAVREALMRAASEPVLPAGFYFDRSSGDLYYEKPGRGDSVSEVRVCPHIAVLGVTHGSGGFGYLLQWTDKIGSEHKQAVPARLFQQQGTQLAELLADFGFEIEPGSQNAFKKFILGMQIDRHIRNVTRTGWVGDSYVLPNETIGSGDEEIVLQTDSSALDGMFQTSGTLAEWQEGVARLCAGNSRHEFALSVGFAGPLLAFSGLDGAIFNLLGSTSTGKSTAQKAAASIWGYYRSHIRNWRVTENGFESICPIFNDNLLLLDELGTCSSKALNEISYLFSMGTGKTRANRNGGARKAATWQACLLSSGELGLAAKLAEDGYRLRGGQGVRFIDVSFSREDLTNTHGLTPEEFTSAIAGSVEKSYGTAGRAFLAELVKDLPAVKRETHKRIIDIALRLAPDRCESEIMRVAKQFALVCLGGETAQKYGILPEGMHIFYSVQDCFNAWLSRRGTLGASDDQALLDQVRLFLEKHGMSRFQDYDNPDEKIINRAGLRKRTVPDGLEYWVYPESYKREVVTGYDLRRANLTLYNAGWLHPGDDGKMARLERIDGRAQRVYVLAPPNMD